MIIANEIYGQGPKVNRTSHTTNAMRLRCATNLP